MLPRCRDLRGNAFDVLIEYLYTDFVTFELSLADELLQLAKQCGLLRLCSEIEREVRLVMMHLRTQQGRVADITRVNLKPGGDTKQGSELRKDMKRLLPMLPPTSCIPVTRTSLACPQISGIDQLHEETFGERYADTFLSCSESTLQEQTVIFKCHRCILVARCEYFGVMLGQADAGLGRTGRSVNDAIPIQMQPWVFHSILQYIYSDAAPSALLSSEDIVAARDTVSSAAHKSEECQHACDELCSAVEVAAAILDSATMMMLTTLRQIAVHQLVQLIAPPTATRCVVLGALFSSVRLLDAATDYIVDNLLVVALPQSAARQVSCRHVEETSTNSTIQLDPSFAAFLKEPAHAEVVLHLVREIVERYSAEDFEDLIGKGGPLRAAAGLAHSAELLGGDRGIAPTAAEAASLGYTSGAIAGASSAYQDKPGQAALVSVVQNIVSDEISRPQVTEAMIEALVEKCACIDGTSKLEVRRELAALKPSALRQKAIEAGIAEATASNRSRDLAASLGSTN